MRRKARRFLSALLTFSLILGNVMVARADDDTGVSAAAATESVGWPKANMSASASSAGADNYTADKAIDGDTGTLWHGQWEGNDIPPHWFSVQLDKDNAEAKKVESIKLTSRKDVNPAHESINNVFCTVWTSLDGENYTEAVKDVRLTDGGGAETTIVLNCKASHIKITGSSNFMAIAEFEAYVYGDDVNLEKRAELIEKIKEVRALADNAVVGKDFNQYPQSAVDALRGAADSAEGALAGDDSQVEQALEELAEAVVAFEASQIIFGRANFEQLIEEAKALDARTQVGTESGNCPEEAKEAFQAAITAAEAKLSETDMDKLFGEYQKLKKAMSDFMSTIIIEDESDSIDISGTWSFEMAAMEEAQNLNETVTLPGSMDENGKGNDNTSNISPTYLNRDYVYTGAATYQREIEIPADWDGKVVTLFLERTRKTRVWVDGNQVGSGQEKSYTAPHEYDLTANVQAGKSHVLTIEVDNSPKDMPEAMYTTFEKDFPWGHMVSEHTQTNWNGILGEIKLEAAPVIHIESFKIRPDVDANIARVKMTVARDGKEGAVSGSIELRAKSYNNKSREHIADVQSFAYAIPEGENKAELTLEYKMGDSVLLWDEFNPNLYEMTAVLRSAAGEEVHASVEKQSFGMRKFEALYVGDGGKQFSVNGRATQLRGEINCAVFPMTGYAPMDLDSWLEVMKIYKDYGFNHVRFHTWVPPKAAFQAADFLGLYIQYELPQWGHKMFGDIDKGDTSVSDYYWNETVKISEFFLNSPSAVMMALGNELRPGFYYYNIFLEKCEELEPEILYTDIAGWSAYTSNVEFSGSVPTRGANYLHRVDPTTDWNHWDNTNRTPVPFLAHEPGQLQVYPDYEEEIRKYYDKNSLMKPRNLEHFQKILEGGGMGDMAKKFNQSSGELSAMLYRYMTEGYLRTPGAGGFQLLGLQDFSGQGTALVGMLDAFMESKGDITPEEFRRSCSELTVLGEFSKFVWKNNETYTADIVIPNYSAADVTTGVKWTLETEDGTKVQSGELEAIEALQGKVTKAGTIEADLSGVKTAQKLKLRLEMTEKPGAGIAPYATGDNDYSVWVYPDDVSEKTPDDVSVYTQFDNQAKKDLENGKNVLIVSNGTSTALPQSKAVTFRPDFWSPMFHNADNDGYVLGCYIDKEHPIFADFPTDTYADWQWYDLVSNSRSILLEGAPVSLKPMVQAIPTIDLDDRLGTLFEAKVGKGKLVVSSIDLLNKESAPAKQLLYSVKKYMSSDKFKPEVELEAEYVRTLLPAKDMKGITASAKEEIAVDEKAAIAVKCVDYQGNNVDMPQGADVEYESKNSQVAEVDAEGTITGISAGMTEIAVRVTAEEITYETSVVVVVGAAKAEAVPTDSLQINVSSQDPSFPAANMTDGDENTFWHSDYSNPEQGMPQEVELVFDRPTAVSAIRCTARKGNIGGAILRASIAVKRSGQTEYDMVIEHAVFDEKQKELVFTFPQTEADSIKLIVEDAVMDSTSKNAAAIAELQIYSGHMVTAIEEFPEAEVRFGTSLEKLMSKITFPKTVKITVDGQNEAEAPVIWNTSSYNPLIAGTYTMEGTIFAEGAVNMGNRKAQYKVTVLPKDLTTPADTTEFNKALEDAGTRKREDYTPDSWKEFDKIYQQAKSFGALTNATQHDTDVMTEKLLDAIAGLVPAQGEIAVTGVSLNKEEITLKIGTAVKLQAEVTPADAANKNVTWSSSAPEAASVNQMGMVKAVAKGETVITVTTEDGGFKAQCKVTVTEESNPDKPDMDEPNPDKPNPDKPAAEGGQKPETSTTDEVQTGDTVNTSMWAVLVVAALGLLGFSRYRKRKKH
ncbi:MAG: Ig-like domain-containing protein [Bariatricus massiliensis]|nr:Ig-like domain-containing protein [Bariatricus massiliensis]